MAVTKEEFKPIFPGTDSKTVMRGQRQFLLTELGAGAKRLAEIEANLTKLTAEYKEVGDTLDKIEENYHTLRGPEAPVVDLKQYEYVKLQYRDFSTKAEALEAQIAQFESAAAAVRAQNEKMRKNVVFLEEKLQQEATVIPLGSKRRQRN